jgi:HSP20 family protein
MSCGIRVYRNGGNALGLLGREFDDSFDHLFGVGNAVVTAPYAVDVREDSDHVYVEADVPGFKKEEVQITLENSTLTISAERSQTRHEDPQAGATPGEEPQWLLNERRYTRFLRSFKLPPTVDEQSVQAKLGDGVLTITINKREETKARKISVN